MVSGPDGAALDRALADLDLLVATDFVQRESHRHAHWLLPAVHWLERDDLLAFTSNRHDEPYVHYGAKAVEPPPGARQEWRIFVDLAIAMPPTLFRAPGLNAFIRATRRAAHLTGLRGLEFGPHRIDRLVLATGRKVNVRRIRWRDVRAHPHGWVLGPREFGHFRGALRTPAHKVRLAPAAFVARARDLLARPPADPPPECPFLLANRRRRHSMNSWLNELPGLHPSGKGTDVVIHPDDACRLGITDGRPGPRHVARRPDRAHRLDRRRTPTRFCDLDHGWGSRVFDPRGGTPADSFGVNRNLLVDAEPVDPLSQAPALNSTFVAVEKVHQS